jgi:hypothetical protein
MPSIFPALASRILVILALVALLSAGVAWQQGLWRIPDRHNPWAPLSLSETPGWTTRLKLSRLSREPMQCFAVLEQARWQIQPLPDRQTGEGCGFQDAVRVDRMGMRLGAPFSLTCPAAVSLALWEQHVLLPASRRHFAAAPVRMEHFGSYACRNLYGREGGARSRHATANAIDIAGFVLEGGRRVAVARDWERDGPAALFLRELHQGACRFFDAALGPDYNAAHADHLHLDRGAHRVCR